MFIIQLDTVNPNDQEFQSYLDQTEIEKRIIQQVGPAGGNPLVQYTAQSHDRLAKMIGKFWSQGDEAENELAANELNHLLSLIKEV